MAFEPLKNIYEKPFSANFGSALQKVKPQINLSILEKEIYTKNWKKLELKDRMRHLTKVLHKYLSKNFETATYEIIALISFLNPKDYKYSALTFLFLPDYIETYGIAYFDISMKAMKSITAFSTCEFAVRPFIVQNQEKALAIMMTWSNHANFHIRRLASEGCRPKLPWAMTLKKLQNDPSPILPILENLKADKEDYVYRSVANNLNDISKDHPNIVLDFAKNSIGKSKTTDWLVKHSLRTLLKAGNQEAMQIFGYGKPGNAILNKFNLYTNQIEVGEYLSFNFELLTQKKAINRLEYAIYFLKQNGDLSKKVFKISEKENEKNSITKIEKRHSFKLISTKKYHKGKHQIAIIINGLETEKHDFDLR